MHDDLFVIIEELVLGTPRPVLAGFFVILASLILTWIKQGADERERLRRYHVPLFRLIFASGTEAPIYPIPILPRQATSCADPIFTVPPGTRSSTRCSQRCARSRCAAPAWRASGRRSAFSEATRTCPTARKCV